VFMGLPFILLLVILYKEWVNNRPKKSIRNLLNKVRSTDERRK
jgi:hypothetical protein